MTNEDLNEMKDRIKKNLEAIKKGRGPYSRNIIGMELRAIDQHFGTASANQVIEELNLERYGFNKEPLK
jgi:hypothetical protein